VPAVVVSQPRDALAVVERQAARMRAPLSVAGEDWTATEERGWLVYQDSDGLLDLPAPKLYGRHQFENAGAAIAALRASGLKLPAPVFEAGMVRVDWPARMQRLTQGRLAGLLQPESELWLDGGHNPDGGRAIAAALADLEERVSRPLVLVVGMMATKDGEGFLRNFSGLARRVITVPIHQEKALPATMSKVRLRWPRGSNLPRRRASSSPARCTSPARSWPPMARRRSEYCRLYEARSEQQFCKAR
jgi:dihydrofolate synthase/folylpolyglutamate synthase